MKSVVRHDAGALSFMLNLLIAQQYSIYNSIIDEGLFSMYTVFI